MSLSPISSEPLSGAQIAVLEQQLVTVTAERDRLAHERDEYKSQTEWLLQQLERLKYDAKTPRERVDPRQIQLVFEPFAHALLNATAPAEGSEPTSPPGGNGTGRNKPRKSTPHGRRILPEHLPVETLVLKPSPLPEDAIEVGAEISWRLGYRRASYYRLRIVRPQFAVSKEAAEKSTEVTATLLSGEGAAPLNGGDGESAETTSAPSERIATDAEPTEATPTRLEETTAEAMSCGNHGASAPLVAAPGAPTAVAAASQQPETRTGREALAPGMLDRTIVVAPAPEEIIPRGLPTPDLLAHILVGKFADKLPFNRQEGISAREGVPITRGTMCGWTEEAHELARFVVQAMEEDARQHAPVIATDATGVLVQANEKCKKGHFWVYVADRDHTIFRYSPVHSSDEPKAFFKGFHGTVLSDASNVYDVLFGLPDSPGEANCWSHARRYFYKAIDSENRDQALIGLGFCNELFDRERQWKKLPPEQRLQMRRQRSSPVIEMLQRWKDEQLDSPHVAEGSRLRKALNYLTNQWPALCKFLEDGRLPIHNNESERQLRSLVVGRANWVFIGSDDTAPWTCTFASLMGSCYLHQLDSEGYLRDLLRVLPFWPKNRMLELSPKFWRATRALLDDAQMALPLGPLTVPPARPLRETAITEASV